MDIIRENIILIILILGGAISQWLKARGEATQNQGPDFDPAEIEEMIEQAEQRQSRPAVPPPLPQATISPAPAMRRKSRTEESAPAVTSFDTSDELARQQQIAEKLKEAKRTRGAREMSESLSPRTRATIDRPPVTGGSLKSRLGSRHELRQAFVLKEILEKPIGLR